MAKLSTPTTAGFNAGKTFYAKPVKVSEIIIDPEIAGLFDISPEILEEIKQSILKNGYNKEEPVVVWKGHNILVDGRTRYTAVKELGFEEIPVVEREFEDREAAILYTFVRQVLRRNLSNSEIMKTFRMISGTKYGEGRVKELAKLLGIGKSTAYQALSIIQEGPQEIVEAVENGDMSIKKGSTAIKQLKAEAAEDVAPPVDECQAQLPDFAGFLKNAVVILLKAEQEKAAELLICHFLRENEREGFYGLLPADVRKHLGDSTGIFHQWKISPQLAR